MICVICDTEHAFVSARDMRYGFIAMGPTSLSAPNKWVVDRSCFPAHYEHLLSRRVPPGYAVGCICTSCRLRLAAPPSPRAISMLGGSIRLCEWCGIGVCSLVTTQHAAGGGAVRLCPTCSASVHYCDSCGCILGGGSGEYCDSCDWDDDEYDDYDDPEEDDDEVSVHEDDVAPKAADLTRLRILATVSCKKARRKRNA